jgi:ethanolamine ammonia-lyase small subunit
MASGPRSKRPRGAGREFARLARATPARLGVGRAGPRYTTAALLKFRADHARAVDAVVTEVPPDWPRRNGLLELRTRAETREQYLLRPELGRMLAGADAERLAQRYARPEFRISERSRRRGAKRRPLILACVGDGLSSSAVIAGAATLVRALRAKLGARYDLMAPIFIRNARVRVEDHIGEIVRPDLICLIIGERPGLATAESLSAYILYRPRLSSLEPDRTVISNIHRGGIRAAEAARRIADVIAAALKYRATGALLAERMARERQPARAGGMPADHLL